MPLGEDAFRCELPYISCDRDLESEEWTNARKVRRALNIAIDRQKLVNKPSLWRRRTLVRELLGQGFDREVGSD